jgi:hypothetical protein
MRDFNNRLDDDGNNSKDIEKYLEITKNVSVLISFKDLLHKTTYTCSTTISKLNLKIVNDL